jgi:hypothetical protein
LFFHIYNFLINFFNFNVNTITYYRISYNLFNDYIWRSYSRFCYS